MSRAAAPRILLSPLGPFEGELLAAVAGEVRRVFGCETRSVRLLDEVGFARDPLRGQLGSTPILERLAAACPPDALKVLALTEEDLFIPVFTYVFGEAQLGGRAAIVSTHRLGLAPGFPVAHAALCRRLLKEAVHELGHTFGLRHCPDASCLMHYCRSARDVDRKGGELCRYCRILLNDALARCDP